MEINHRPHLYTTPMSSWLLPQGTFQCGRCSDSSSFVTTLKLAKKATTARKYRESVRVVYSRSGLFLRQIYGFGCLPFVLNPFSHGPFLLQLFLGLFPAHSFPSVRARPRSLFHVCFMKCDCSRGFIQLICPGCFLLKRPKLCSLGEEESRMPGLLGRMH